MPRYEKHLEASRVILHRSVHQAFTKTGERGATAALPLPRENDELRERYGAGSGCRSIGVLVEPTGDPGQENLLRDSRARPFWRAAHVPALRIDPCILGAPALEQQERIVYRHLRVARA